MVARGAANPRPRMMNKFQQQDVDGVELPNENPDIGKSTDPAVVPVLPPGVANIWHVNKLHKSTYAMIVPLTTSSEDNVDWCKLIIRVDILGAGSAVALEGIEMSVADAMNILSEFYKQTLLRGPVPNF